jgi:hypothetical protein
MKLLISQEGRQLVCRLTSGVRPQQILPWVLRDWLSNEISLMRLCVSDQGLARMRSYEEKKITEPSRSIEV